MTQDHYGLTRKAAIERLPQLRCGGAKDLTELAIALGFSRSTLRAAPREVRWIVNAWFGREIDKKKGKPGRKRFELDEEVPESESLLFALLRLRHGWWRANGEVPDSPQFDLLRQVWWDAVTCKKKQVARQKARSAHGKYKRAPQRRVQASKPIDRSEQLLAIQRTNERLLLDPRTLRRLDPRPKERLLSDEITMELVTDYFAIDAIDEDDDDDVHPL